MAAPARPEEVPQFHAERPDDIRRATPWHRYAHHINTLPTRLQALAPQLGVGEGDRLLDLGCADVPYRHFFEPGVDYVAADIPGNPNATMSLNPDGTVPSPDQTFDAVLSTQVLEHVSQPALYLEEAFRVLRPGGRLLLSTHGTFSYHPDPVDLWRWTCAGLRLEVERAGFEVIEFQGIIGPVAAGIQLIQDVTIYRMPRLLRPLYALVMQSIARLSDRLEGQWMRDINGSIYALVAERPSP